MPLPDVLLQMLMESLVHDLLQIPSLVLDNKCHVLDAYEQCIDCADVT